MYPGLGLGLGLQLLLLPLLLLACAMVKTPASDFSAEISAKWALWPLPGPGLANRGRSAARSSAKQKLLPSNEIFRTCYCPCLQSSVAVAVSLAARCCSGHSGSASHPWRVQSGFVTVLLWATLPNNRTAIRAGRLVVVF